ncbi:hypothetical protein D1610_11495 [Sphingomonas gilva]|uniref:Uncharacterized protein n=1 Tax=Sphingomonas gilva TaxID=2305907 RepID=A0A396RN58_9SPHN|nr:hypothetical protein [Sphingomonas gilva]RHW17166.1 hypothetical protein D1610_11495 [Sphingomonas gilva]
MTDGVFRTVGVAHQVGEKAARALAEAIDGFVVAVEPIAERGGSFSCEFVVADPSENLVRGRIA